MDTFTPNNFDESSFINCIRERLSARRKIEQEPFDDIVNQNNRMIQVMEKMDEDKSRRSSGDNSEEIALKEEIAKLIQKNYKLIQQNEEINCTLTQQIDEADELKEQLASEKLKSYTLSEKIEKLEVTNRNLEKLARSQSQSLQEKTNRENDLTIVRDSLKQQVEELEMKCTHLQEQLVSVTQIRDKYASEYKNVEKIIIALQNNLHSINLIEQQTDNSCSRSTDGESELSSSENSSSDNEHTKPTVAHRFRSFFSKNSS